MPKPPTYVTTEQLSAALAAITLKIPPDQSAAIADLKQRMLALESAQPKPLPSPSIIIPRFADDAWCYQQIPANVPLHPNSANFAVELQSQMPPGQNMGVNAYQYTPPLFVASPSDPRIRVEALPYDKYGILPGLQEMWNDVPMPAVAQPSSGTDREMVIFDPDKDRMYEFWAALKNDKGWSALRGGRMLNVRSNPAAWTGGGNFGVTGAGLPFAASIITAEELQAGEIKHVIGVALGRAEHWDTWSWPAQKSDGWNLNPTLPNQIPEGLRFRFDPAIDPDSLVLTPVGKTIFRAGQKYGFIGWDKTGGIPSIRLLNASSYTLIGQADPYPALFDGLQTYEILRNIPWDKTQFLPMNWGQK